MALGFRVFRVWGFRVSGFQVLGALGLSLGAFMDRPHMNYEYHFPLACRCAGIQGNLVVQ